VSARRSRRGVRLIFLVVDDLPYRVHGLADAAVNVTLGFLSLAFPFEVRLPIALPAYSLIVAATAMLLVGRARGLPRLTSAGIWAPPAIKLFSLASGRSQSSPR
jgi:hypothetical protein